MDQCNKSTGGFVAWRSKRSDREMFVVLELANLFGNDGFRDLRSQVRRQLGAIRKSGQFQRRPPRRRRLWSEWIDCQLFRPEATLIIYPPHKVINIREIRFLLVQQLHVQVKRLELIEIEDPPFTL